MAENDLAKRTLSLKKTFDVPIELVWEAWTQPEHIAHWWGPKGMSLTVVEHNFKVGGKWKYVMPMPGGGVFVSEGQYSEIVKFQKIVTSANFRPMTEGVEIRVLFEKMETRQTSSSALFIQPKNIKCSRRRWDSTTDGLQRLTDLQFLSTPSTRKEVSSNSMIEMNGLHINRIVAVGAAVANVIIGLPDTIAQNKVKS